MNILYVNPRTQEFANVDGKFFYKRLSIDFATEKEFSFQFINDENEVIDIENGDYYLAANNSLYDYDSCCFLSKDYTITNNVITFKVDTFNENFKNKVSERNTILFLELGFKKVNGLTYTPLFSHSILAHPRVFVSGEIPSSL